MGSKTASKSSAKASAGTKAASKTASKASGKPAKGAAKAEKPDKSAKAASAEKPAEKPTASAEKSVEKPAAKSAGKTAAKPSAAKSGEKSSKTSAKGAESAKDSKATASEKAASKTTTDKTPADKAGGDKAAGDKAGGRKGITIVTPKRPRSSKPKAAPAFMMSSSGGGSLLPRKPLIPSGPNATAPTTLELADPNAKKKSPFNKTQLDRFRKILLDKRANLAGEVSGLEQEALRGSSGSLSHTPSHMAEQGSEAADQSLSLDLAAAERKLIREIDEALKRIETGVYGLCELTGKPIPADRLEELPWTRYSIDAARELERRSFSR